MKTVFSLLIIIITTTVLALVTVAIPAKIFSQEQIQQKQILVNPSNIANISSYEQYNNPKYTKYYKPENLFDNSVGQNSWWSQYGKSGFLVNFKQPLKEQVCNADIEVAQIPQNSSFNLSIGNKSFSGS